MKYHEPKVYVGTYGKYNDGSLKGAWVDLDDFVTYDDFMAYCRKLHGDEKDPEFMFQDYEDIPSAFIGESYLSEDFWDFMNDEDIDENVKYAIIEEEGDYDSYQRVKDDIMVFPEARTMEDVAYAYVDEIGGLEQLGDNLLQQYFDYEGFGRDVAIEWRPDEDEDGSVYEHYGVGEGDDAALGEEIINEMGFEGIDMTLYFDYAEFGRAMENESKFVKYGADNDGDWGIVEIFG